MDAIERVARQLCKAAGQNPDRRLQDYGRSSFSYPAWEDFRPAALVVLSEQPKAEGLVDGGEQVIAEGDGTPPTTSTHR